MPAKKTKKPARSVRYLLSADRKLEKLSLKKIKERPKDARVAAPPDRRKRPARTKVPVRAPSIVSAAVAAGAVFLVAAAVVFAARQSPDAPETHLDDAPAPAQSLPAAAVIEQPAGMELVQARAVSPAPKRPPLASRTDARTDARPAPEPAPAADVQPPPAVTLTGCVAIDKKRAWLKNASGAALPKSRSWKSGFLAKRANAIALVNPGGTLDVSAYAGNRVAVTGALVDGDMQVRSVRRLSSSCGR